MQSDFPWDAERFQPGLLREEIEEKISELPFSLPEEVYELYQWRNGNPSGNLLIPGKLAGCQEYFWFMLSLEDALDAYWLRGEMSRLQKKGIIWDQHYFPIFQSLHEQLFHVIEIGKKTSRLSLFDPSEGRLELLCDGLPELLKIEADYFEQQSKTKPWLG